MAKMTESLSQKIGQWWASLSEKDRKTLLFALPVVFILVCYLLVFQPIYTRYSVLNERHEKLSETLVWLYDNAALVNRLQNQCSRTRLIDQGSDQVTDYVKNISRRGGATANVRITADQMISVDVERLAGNRAVALVQAFVCHGFSVSDVSIYREEVSNSNVSISLSLSASHLVSVN